MFFKKKNISIDSVIHSPQCSVCTKPSAHIEVVAPGGYPEESKTWSAHEMGIYKKYRNFDSYYLFYSGPGGSNGMIGDAISLQRVALLKSAFSRPYDATEIKKQFYDMAGYCLECEKFYCTQHWNLTASGSGYCPDGHSKRLDPHLSPELL